MTSLWSKLQISEAKSRRVVDNDPPLCFLLDDGSQNLELMSIRCHHVAEFCDCQHGPRAWLYEHFRCDIALEILINRFISTLETSTR